MADVILETKNLTREFKGFVAVNDVNLKVQRGHIHALIGPNGAGKTTCFNLLTKFLVPSSGQILFNGGFSTAIKAFPVSESFESNCKLRKWGSDELIEPTFDLLETARAEVGHAN
jgi:ABC-type branched-subunit amino acid transport system ATPase component